MQLVFVSGNKNKVAEVQKLIGNKIKLLGLKDINCDVDIPETSNSFAGNALQKAKYVFDNYKLNCFADDSGLEVKALDGAPGVDSAYYAGPQKNDADNLQKLLNDLKVKSDRTARFRTVIALILDGKEHFFEGVINGTILPQPAGNGGFGYDPVFVPDGYDKTFAQMGLEEKNRISHRAIATQKLIQFLNSIA
jgi:XTP/dITP diphosphohydrolase